MICRHRLASQVSQAHLRCGALQAGVRAAKPVGEVARQAVHRRLVDRRPQRLQDGAHGRAAPAVAARC